MRESKPVFQGVVDLGLRDVGVENDPRGLAARFGKDSLIVFGLVILSTFVMCAIVAATGGGGWLAIPLALTWTGAIFMLALRSSRRSPMVVVKVTAEGANQATWLMLVPFVLMALMAILAALGGDPLFLPLVAITAIFAAFLVKRRDYAPAALRKLRTVLAADEVVLGDGVGRAPKERGWHRAFRIVVATDRRLIVATSARPTKRYPLVDVPYDRVSGFGVAWKQLGRAGELTLTVAAAGGAPAETHVIDSMAPANLVSITRTLRAHGVDPDDPAGADEAERGWDDALRASLERRAARAAGPRGARRTTPRRLLTERPGMNTPAFDHGLWLLLGLTAFAFYVNPFGVGLGTARDPDVAVLVVVPIVCGVSSYVSGTRSALTYLVPLNLLVSPAFFFAPTVYVIAMMIMMSAFAAAGLWAGSALRGATASPDGEAGPGGRAPRGSLRYTLSGQGLIRITGIMLAGMLVLVASAGAAGFELTSLRLAIDEKTLKQVPVDGESNLTGGAATVTYTRGPDLHEFITDQSFGTDPADGARWELRSSYRKGVNVVSLASYVQEPRLDDPAAIADFVERKDREHSRLAGSGVTHTERVVDGRRGYVWDHRSPYGYWYHAAWFPHPRYTVRVECIARRQEERFKRLCAEAVRTLEFR